VQRLSLAAPDGLEMIYLYRFSGQVCHTSSAPAPAAPIGAHGSALSAKIQSRFRRCAGVMLGADGVKIRPCRLTRPLGARRARFQLFGFMDVVELSFSSQISWRYRSNCR
jgi:hypothetical protein